MNLTRRMTRGGITVSAATKRDSQVSLSVSLLLFAVYVFLARFQPELRYTRYALPAALVGVWLARRAQGEPLSLFAPPLRSFALMMTALLLWSGAAIGFTSTFYPRFFEEAIFFVAPLLAAMVCAALKRDDRDWPFYVLLAILTADYAMEIGLETIVSVMRQPYEFLLDLLQSSAPTESTRAFAFGVLAILFLGRRRLLTTAACVLLAFLAGKRIVLLGLGVGMPLMLLAPSLERTPRRVAVTIVAVALNLMTAMSLRNLDDWGIAARIQDVTMQSADTLLMGRAKLYGMLAERLPDIPIAGAGLGRITQILDAEGAWLTNTHSDVLKHFIELGPVMFSIWIGCFYWSSRRKGTLALTVFINVLFLSDNVAIYFDVMFSFYWAFVYLDKRKSETVTESNRRRRPTCREPLPQAALSQAALSEAALSEAALSEAA